MKPIEWDDLSGGTEAQVDTVRLTIHGGKVNAWTQFVVNVDDHDMWVELDVDADEDDRDKTAWKLIGLLRLMRTRTEV